MWRLFALFALAAITVGCGSKNRPEVAAKPADDEVRTNIVEHLKERGLSEVEFASLAQEPNVPKAAEVNGEAWAFKFSASFKNVFGEKQSNSNWIAVLTRHEGKTSVAMCLDEKNRPLGGKAEAPVDDMPPIVAPKP